MPYEGTSFGIYNSFKLKLRDIYICVLKTPNIPLKTLNEYVTLQSKLMSYEITSSFEIYCL